MTRIAELNNMRAHELEEDCQRLRSEMKTLSMRAEAENRSFTDGEDQRCENLLDAIQLREALIADKTAETPAARAALIERAARQPKDDPGLDAGIINVGQHAPNQTRRITNGDVDRGRSTIDEAFRSGHLPDHAAEKATALVEHGHEGERSLAGRWASAAGDVHYRGAFAKLLADPTRGHLLWTPAEQEAFRNVSAVDSEMRAMSTTAANGGYMIPLTLDPAIMLTNAGSINPLRQLATVKRTMTNTWQGVTSAGATSEWKSEATEVADGAPTLSDPSIPVHLGDSFVPYSYEVGQDAVDFLSELSGVLADSADNLQATAYTTGSGSGQPEGIIKGLTGTASEINATVSESLTAADVYALQNALRRACWANCMDMSK